MYIAALFIIAETRNQPKFPITNDGLKVMTYVYYSAIKKHEILPFAASWMSLYSIKLSKISQAEKNKYCILSHICEI